MSAKRSLGAADVVAKGADEVEPASPQGARVLADAVRLAERLQAALAAQVDIDRAVGVIMGLSGGTEAAALDRLRAVSRTEEVDVGVVARQIIDGAVGSARAQHRG
jgi:hypothetical protein